MSNQATQAVGRDQVASQPVISPSITGLQDVVTAGVQAFEAGKPEAANPYYRQTDHGKAWAAGYEAARGPLPKLGPLEYRETSDYGAAHMVSKTHKIGEGRFAAVGAVFFQGCRCMYVSAVGATRRAAEKAVLAILDPDPYAAERSERRLRAMGG